MLWYLLIETVMLFSFGSKRCCFQPAKHISICIEIDKKTKFCFPLCNSQKGFGGTACEKCAEDNLFGPDCTSGKFELACNSDSKKSQWSGERAQRVPSKSCCLPQRTQWGKERELFPLFCAREIYSSLKSVKKGVFTLILGLGWLMNSLISHTSIRSGNQKSN